MNYCETPLYDIDSSLAIWLCNSYTTYTMVKSFMAGFLLVYISPCVDTYEIIP